MYRNQGRSPLAHPTVPPPTGPAAGEVGSCGLYASTWDREAEGCDPDPNRRVQESYGLHFLNALGGRDRDGQSLPTAELDLDGDGRISPLEAHARVRVASRSISVPTTSAEWWLRARAPKQGPRKRFAWPEEEAVVAALSQAAGIRANSHAPEQANLRLAKLEKDLAALGDRIHRLEQERDERWRSLQAVLLERWPSIDDPWREDFSSALARGRSEIEATLTASTEAQAYRQAEAAVQSAAEPLGPLEEDVALAGRLCRAYQNLELAERLAARGGEALERLEALLRCERAPLASR